VRKKSELFNDAMFAVFEKVETAPPIVFSLAQLKQISKTFTPNTTNFLKKVYRDIDKSSYTDEDGERRYYRRRGGELLSIGQAGVMAEDKESAEFYQFDIQGLIQSIKTMNALTGQVCSIDDRLSFIGECNTGDRQFGVFLAFLSDDEQAKRLLGLRSNVKQYDWNLILCPTFEMSDQNLINRLESQNIYCETFKRAFKDGVLKIDFSIIKGGLKTSTGFVIPDLTATERRKYQNDYPRRDIIEFIDKTTAARSGVVLINGRELELQYNLYGLLLALALSLKQEKDSGWVHYDDIEKEKLIRSRDHFHRSMSELSGKLDPFVEDNKIKLLQNLKRKSKYRLSTMPSRLKTPHSRWLASRYKAIKDEIIKERAKRVGEANM